jgi:thioredoxin-like negative regulator of GroEL
MQKINNQADLDALLTEQPAVLLLYGGQHCGVCQTLKPRIQHLLNTQFPRIHATYIDCQDDAACLCAQQGIMTLPVVQIWFTGTLFAELLKVFALDDIQAALSRPYALMFD